MKALGSEVAWPRHSLTAQKTPVFNMYYLFIYMFIYLFIYVFVYVVTLLLTTNDRMNGK
jgi:type IV secretory pathway VirB3-like protein